MLSPSVPELPRILTGEREMEIIVRPQKTSLLDFTRLRNNFARFPLLLAGMVERILLFGLNQRISPTLSQVFY